MTTIVLNISRLLTFMRCPQLYEHMYESNRGRESTPALRFGTAVHGGLEWLYSSFPTPHTPDVVAAFKEAYMKASSTDLTDDDVQLLVYGERLIEGYCKRWESDPTTFTEIKLVESPLVAKIERDGLTVYLVGRPDMFAKTELGGGSFWHVQHKTASANTSYDKYTSAYDLSWHERAYKLMAAQNGIHISGSILNIIRKTKQIHTEGDHTFARFYIPVSDESVYDFKGDLLVLVSWMLTGNRPKFSESCYKYNRCCKFHDMCMGMPSFGLEEEEEQKGYVDYTEVARTVLEEKGELTSELLKEALG